MQKPEYAVVTLVPKVFNSHQVMIYWPDGSETKQEKSIARVLTEMAAEGWEVVTTAGEAPFLHWTLRRGP